jgi:hypothetical protein
MGKRGRNPMRVRGRSQSYYLYRKIRSCDTITRPKTIYHFPFIVGHFSFGTVVEEMTNEKWKMRNGK